MEAKRAAVNTTPALVDDPGVEDVRPPQQPCLRVGVTIRSRSTSPAILFKKSCEHQTDCSYSFAKPNLLKNVAHDRGIKKPEDFISRARLHYTREKLFVTRKQKLAELHRCTSGTLFVITIKNLIHAITSTY